MAADPDVRKRLGSSIARTFAADPSHRVGFRRIECRPGGRVCRAWTLDAVAVPSPIVFARTFALDDYYRILGVQSDASPEAIKEAYRDQVKVWHPDRFANDPKLQLKAADQMLRINEAYDRLKSEVPESTMLPGPTAPERPAEVENPVRPDSPTSTRKSTEPVAKRPVRGFAVKAAPEDELPVDTRSPWEIHGWAYSITGHAILLLILGLWYFGSRPSQVKRFDTRLLGSEFGVDEGMKALGGLDTPTRMPELTAPTTTAETTFLRPQPTDMAPAPMAGFQGNTGNPGAGQGDGFGLAKFGNGGEEVRGVKVQVGDPQFTLLWDSVADIDLHVIEPGGKMIYWNDRKGNQGGELDVDNTDGYGPENIYWLKQNPDGSKDLGPGPPGEYKWFVKYYGGNRGVPVATRWKVRIKHEGKAEIFQGRLTVPGAQTKVYTLTVGPPQTRPTEGMMPDFKP